MKRQAILLTSRTATAVRRFVLRFSVFAWKGALLFFITMAVALTALAFNAALFVYRKLSDRWTTIVRNFFETYFYAELRERCSVLEGRFDQVHGQIGQLKAELNSAAKTQMAVEERTLQRLELLNQVMAEGNALLEKIASKEAAYGFVGTFHHHHHQDGGGESLQQSPAFQAGSSFDAGAFSKDDRLQRLTPSPSSSKDLEMFSSFPIDSILNHLNSNGDSGIGGGGSSRGSCAFYGSSESCCSSLSPPVRRGSNCTPSPAPRPQNPPPPPPPPPPPASMFACGKVSFKRTTATTAATTSVQASKAFVVSESEIAAMRNKLKKVPAKGNQIEKEDS